MDQQSRDMMKKYAVTSYMIWSAMALIQDFFIFFRRDSWPVQWALHQPQISISKIELVIPSVERVREYM